MGDPDPSSERVTPRSGFSKQVASYPWEEDRDKKKKEEKKLIFTSKTSDSFVQDLPQRAERI